MIHRQGKIGSAVYSDCMNYRYELRRPIWRKEGKSRCDQEPEGGVCNFLMLNPSTATEDHNDPTIRRCIGYATDWGYGTLIITNIFALRSTDPMGLRQCADPVGPDNDQHILDAAEEALESGGFVICAWGNHGLYNKRHLDILKLLDQMTLHALDVTKEGMPKHPLYQAKDARLQYYPKALCPTCGSSFAPFVCSRKDMCEPCWEAVVNKRINDALAGVKS